MRTTLILCLCLFAGCQAVERGRQQVRRLLGMSTPMVPAETPEYSPAPPPSIEEDKVVQVTPRVKVFALLEQALESGDAAAQEQFLHEFGEQRALFGVEADAELVSALNRAVANVQAKDLAAIQTLVRLHPLLQGANQAHLRVILGRALDSVPAHTLSLMARTKLDPNCLIAATVPVEVVPEQKRGFYEARLAGLAGLRASLAADAGALSTLEACERLLQTEIDKIPPPVEPVLPESGETPPPDSAPQPVAPSATP